MLLSPSHWPRSRLVLPTGADGPSFFFFSAPAILFAAAAVALFVPPSRASLIALLILVHIAAFCLIGLAELFCDKWPCHRLLVPRRGRMAARLARRATTCGLATSILPIVQRLANLALPLLFGAWLLILWEIIVRGFGVPTILLPPPSMIAARIAASVPTLWADFQQTFLKAAIAGYAIGCGSGFHRSHHRRPRAFPAQGIAPHRQPRRRLFPSSASRRSWSCGSAPIGNRRRLLLSS